MDNIAGSPVEGENFFGRDADVARLRDMLNHDDILLLGPRRIGKTSVARAVMAQVRNEGWRSIEINVASYVDERDFLGKLNAALKPELATLSEKAKNAIQAPLSAVAQRLKSVSVPIPGTDSLNVELHQGNEEDWATVANDLLRLIARADDPWLIYVDELPILLFNIIRNDPGNGVQRVRRFLDWFRNDVRALPDAGQVRWLVSGSVGLDTLVQQHRMADTINSMKHEGLEPFTKPVALTMLDKLAQRYGIDLPAEAAQTLVDGVQWPQPYYLQLAFHHFRTLRATSPDADADDLIDSAIDKMMQPGEDNDFHHWAQRLELQLSGDDAGHAVALLNHAANDRSGARAEMLLATLQQRLPDASDDETRRCFIQLRDILQRDAYWLPDDSSGQKRYRFRLEPLRRWWKRRNTL